MTKRFSILCMLLLAMYSMVLVSCDKDNDNDENDNPIVGTWVRVEGSGQYSYTITAILNADGTFLVLNEENTGYIIKAKGTYTVKGNKLSLFQTEKSDPGEYGDNEWHKANETSEGLFEIKGNKLYLYGDDGTLEYTRR